MTDIDILRAAMLLVGGIAFNNGENYRQHVFTRAEIPGLPSGVSIKVLVEVRAGSAVPDFLKTAETLTPVMGNA